MGLASRIAALAVSCIGATACSNASVFSCVQDGQCGAGGTCQADGWCSFVDDDCPSGSRYGEHAGEDLGGACVPAGEGSSGPAPTGGSATTPEPDDGTSSGPSSSTIALTGAVDDGSTGGPVPPTTGSPQDDSGSATGSDTGPSIDPALVAWYTFDDATNLYADASGNGRDAWCDLEQCPQYEAGATGGAILLDGIDDHLHVDHDPGLALTEDFSIALWVRVDATTLGEFTTIASKPLGPGTANSWEVGVPGSMNLYAGAGNVTEFAYVQIPLDTTGVWHHLAFTRGAEDVLLYLDGSEVDTAPTVGVEYDDHPMMIGADIDNEIDDNFLTGKIDDLRIYARVLDPSEIADFASERP
jgi:hypothetical protein